MPITWSEAVAHANNDDDSSRYRRALAQVAELEPLVLSFINAVKEAGQWPTVSLSDYTNERGPGLLYTRPLLL